MKKAIYNAGRINLITATIPIVRPTELLVKISAAGVNPCDAKFLIGDKLPLIFLPIIKRLVSGWGVGFDFSGVVVGVGENCGGNFSVGDEVFGIRTITTRWSSLPKSGGSLSEFCSLPFTNVALKPANLSYVDSSALPLVSLTAIQIFRNNKIGKGQTVLVIGASGGTGHVGVQIAKALGARVCAICSAANAEFVKGLGADAVVCYDSEGRDDRLVRIAAELSGSGKFDIVLDTVTSNASIDINKYYQSISRLKLLSVDGKYINLGGSPSAWFLAYLKRSLQLNLFPRQWELFWIKFEDCGTDLATIAQWCEEGKLKVHVSKVYGFTEDGVDEAFQALISRRTVGKLVVKV
jgi:NADPH:quinone reductase-like Zn-dependent oxidoreductase